jgi:hypothetical protein
VTEIGPRDTVVDSFKLSHLSDYRPQPLDLGEQFGDVLFVCLVYTVPLVAAVLHVVGPLAQFL